MSNSKIKFMKQASIVIAATASGVVGATTIDAKNNTIEELKQFESKKPEAMKSLLEKLQAQNSKDPIFQNIEDIAKEAIEKIENSDKYASRVYLKPQQAHSEL
ncbi:hypothetical protein ACET8B_20735 [Aeromonas caviae]|nr:hypothetical protein [Aeromonas sp. QDB30]